MFEIHVVCFFLSQSDTLSLNIVQFRQNYCYKVNTGKSSSRNRYRYSDIAKKASTTSPLQRLHGWSDSDKTYIVTARLSSQLPSWYLAFVVKVEGFPNRSIVGRQCKSVTVAEGTISVGTGDGPTADCTRRNRFVYRGVKFEATFGILLNRLLDRWLLHVGSDVW